MDNPESVGFEKADYSKIVEKDPRFDSRFYDFLIDAMMRFFSANPEKHAHDLDMCDFLEDLRNLALDSFGPLAYATLEYWGVRSCRDIAAAVQNLYEAKYIKAMPSGNPDEYLDYYDFKMEFLDPFKPEGEVF